jgi:hypothetical protein
MREGKASKAFFSEEKKQKTFMSRARGTIRDLAGIVEPAGELKVFCFFFSKKKCLPHLFPFIAQAV